MSNTDADCVEVELKFPLADADRVRRILRDLGAMPHEAIEQVDTYFAHPVRDFAATDEALRIRCTGETGCVTYKGPLLDRDTKSREETELAFAGGAGDARRFSAVLQRLGFAPVRDVRKTREPWRLGFNGFPVEVAFDEIAGLGHFIEIETTSTRGRFEPARQAVLDLAKRLDLHSPERRSYLSLLLEGDFTR